jgi:hypothetical protein
MVKIPATDSSSLYDTGKYTDMTVKCQGKEWKVHRAIVCSQSKPLAAAMDGKFKVSFFLETGTQYKFQVLMVAGSKLWGNRSRCRRARDCGALSQISLHSELFGRQVFNVN